MNKNYRSMTFSKDTKETELESNEHCGLDIPSTCNDTQKLVCTQKHKKDPVNCQQCNLTVYVISNGISPNPYYLLSILNGIRWQVLA